LNPLSPVPEASEDSAEDSDAEASPRDQEVIEDLLAIADTMESDPPSMVDNDNLVEAQPTSIEVVETPKVSESKQSSSKKPVKKGALRKFKSLFRKKPKAVKSEKSAKSISGTTTVNDKTNDKANTETTKQAAPSTLSTSIITTTTAANEQESTSAAPTTTTQDSTRNSTPQLFSSSPTRAPYIPKPASPMDPLSSVKAKREAWKNKSLPETPDSSEFDSIISSKADDTWNVTPETTTTTISTPATPNSIEIYAAPSSSWDPFGSKDEGDGWFESEKGWEVQTSPLRSKASF